MQTIWRLLILGWMLSFDVRAAIAESPVRLSLFEEQDKKCIWSALDVGSSTKTKLALFDRSCLGVTVTVNSSQSAALVWFRNDLRDGPMFSGSSFASYPASHVPPGTSENVIPALWLVDLATHRLTSVPWPKEEKVSEIKLDESGRIFAFVEKDVSADWTQAEMDRVGTAKKFTYQNKTYDYPYKEGLPALAVALRWATGAAGWEKIETKVTHTGWDYALGVGALTSFTNCCGEKESSWNNTEDSEKVIKELGAKLISFAPGKNDSDHGIWQVVHPKGCTDAVDLVAWAVSGEFLHNTGLFLFFKDRQLNLPETPFFNASDLPNYSFDNCLMLLSSSGLSAHPRVYDIRSREIKFSSDNAVGVSFWNSIVLRKNANNQAAPLP